MECWYHNVIPYLKYCASSELAINWANPNSSRRRGSFGSSFASSGCVCVCVCVMKDHGVTSRVDHKGVGAMNGEGDHERAGEKKQTSKIVSESACTQVHAHQHSATIITNVCYNHSTKPNRRQC